MNDLRLGILDLGQLTIGDTVEIAARADELGFARYWVAEHAFENSLLATSILAGATSRIRVGPAGVLVRYYSAAAVARDGLYLERAFGRIDLGLASGVVPGFLEAAFSDGRRDTLAPQRFDAQSEAVARWLALGAVASLRPELWLLGSSDNAARARSAARLDAHFCLSLAHHPTPPSPLPIRAYRDAHGEHDPGVAAICLPLSCLESPSERAGYRSPHPGMHGPTFADTAPLCRERIEELCREYDVNEVSILESSPDCDRRLASLELLAAELGSLAGPPSKGRVVRDVPPLPH